MTFNVITSLARPENIVDIINHLKDKGVILHIITDDDAKFEVNFTEPWIKHYVCPNKGSEFWVRCHSALNWFFENHVPNDENYYCVMNDDDGYEDDFFNKLIKSINQSKINNQSNDLIICSMLRGNQIPNDVIPVRRHPTNTLYAHPTNMRVGSVGLITVEHNLYCDGNDRKNKLYELLTNNGFTRVVEDAPCLDKNPLYYNKPYEDWYINSNLLLQKL